MKKKIYLSLSVLDLSKNLYFDFNIGLYMKKKTLKIILNIIKYGVTLILGYLGSDTGIVDDAVSMLCS